MNRGFASLTDLEPHEAPHGDLFAGLGAHLGDEVTDTQLATDIAAFLVPADFNPPLVGGAISLPPSLASSAVATAQVTRKP